MATLGEQFNKHKQSVVSLNKEVKLYESQVQSAINTQNNYLKTLVEHNKVEEKTLDLSKLKKKDLREQVKLEESLNTRTRILTASIKMNNDQFNLGAKTFLDYRKAGGTSLEYLSTFMTSTSEKVKILGFEARSVRRLIYGFFPPGMFRLVNKTATAFNGLGGAYRAIRDNIKDAGKATKDSNNIFSNSIKLLGKLNLNKPLKEAFTILGGSKGRRKRAQNEERLKQIKVERFDRSTQLGNLRGKRKNNPALMKDPAFREQIMALRKELRGLDKEEAGREAYTQTVEGTGFTGKKGKTGINQLLRISQSMQSGLGVRAFIASKNKIFNKATWKGLWAGMLGLIPRLFSRIKSMGRGLKTFFSGQGIFNKENWKNFAKGIVKRGKAFNAKFQMIFRPFMTFLVYAVVYLAIISIIVVFVLKTIKEAWKFTQKVISPFVGMMLNALSGIWDGLTELFSGIINGDLYKIASGLIDIVINVAQFLLGLALTIVVGLGTMVLTMLVTGAKKLFKFVIGIFTGAVDIKKNIGKIFMLVAVIIGLIFGFPVMLGVLLTGLIILAVKKIGEKLKDMVFGVKIIKNVVKGAGKFLGNVRDKVMGAFADGGIVSKSGMQLVGERGPELVRLPKGTRVHSSTESRKMLQNTNNSNTINITINAKDTSDAEMRRIAEKIGRLVNNNINRNTGMSGIR